MNPQFELTYLDNKGDKREEIHGLQAQVIAYALAYEADGFEIISVYDRYARREVNYTGIPFERITEFGYDDRKDET